MSVDGKHGRILVGAALATLLAAGCAGDNGSTTLVSTAAEPAGANCAGGGVKIQTGIDSNANGTLDPGEVIAAQTRYVCNGAGSATTLVVTSPELAGPNCPFGGVKIQTGLDANANGTLDPSEVNASQTSYACNGTVGPSSASTGLVVAVQSVTTTPGSPISVHFTMRDARGFPVDRLGIYTVNTPIPLRFSLSYVTQDADGLVLPYTVLTTSNSAPAKDVFQPTAYSPDPSTSATTKTPAQGTIAEDLPGSGNYTYTFPAADVAQTDTAGAANGVLYKAVAFDSAKLGNSHAVWIQASRQTNMLNTQDPAGFTAVNFDYDFIPNDPTGTPLKREIASTAGCNNCHRGFSAEGLTANAFHGSGRIDAGYCDVCHNPARTSNPAAFSAVFVHRIHSGESLQPDNVFHGIAATYPQDIRNCGACHDGAAQGDQSKTRPTLAACSSCHDQVDFTAAGSSLPMCVHPPAVDAETGIPTPCKHNVGEVADGSCATCHTATKIAGYHVPIQPPDPNNILNKAANPSASNANTNAAFLAAAGSVPTGAIVITYVIGSVDAVVGDDSLKHPSITFKLQRDGQDVIFPDFGSGPTELIPEFVGSPSVYFAFAVPQDGIAKPADYNVTASGYIKNIWNGTATTGTALNIGTLSPRDADGFYTITLPNVIIPDSATMLTGGVGYTYSLTSSIPLTQINLDTFAYHADTKQGGLIVPAPDIFQVAKNFTGRHTVVDNKKCLTCHVTLGAAPTFHAGQRNNGPTCSFCHNPNQSTSGWSGNAKDFIHAIHGARKRTVPFMWHATSADDNFSDVEFPGPLNNCTACHVAGDNDFSSAGSAAAVPNMLMSTVAKGKYDPASPTAFTFSPYVVADNVTDYGVGFSTVNVGAKVCTTSAPCDADPTTLVKSPIVAACSACHDSAQAIDHFQAMGGHFYETRASVMAPGATKEECLLCHGPNKIAAIADVHR